MRRVPLQIDRGPLQFEPAKPPLAENQRQGRYPAVDQLSLEQIGPRRIAGVGNRQTLGQKLDFDRIEEQLEIPADRNLAVRERSGDPLEGMSQEPPLGDEEHEPDREHQRDDPDQHVPDDAPPASGAFGPVLGRTCLIRGVTHRVRIA